jgi:type IV pilus assembly protein PilE
MRGSRTSGFTLIELMVVVAIIAILAALAYNNYSRYAYRSRRVDGQNMLLRVASAEERYYTNYNNYTSTITGSSSSSLGFSTALSDDQHYTVTAAVASGNQSYTLTATPVAGDVQAKDQCGSLTLDSSNNKTPASGVMPQNSNGSCW